MTRDRDYPWVIRGGTSMSIPFAEALLERIEKGGETLGWNADELRAAIAIAKPKDTDETKSHI